MTGGQPYETDQGQHRTAGRPRATTDGSAMPLLEVMEPAHQVTSK